MAVTILRAQLAARIRLGRSQPELDETDELLAYATAVVIKHAPDAPATWCITRPCTGWLRIYL